MKFLMLTTLMALALATHADYLHEYQRSVEVTCKNYNVDFEFLIDIHGKCQKYDSTVRLQLSPKHQGFGLFASRMIRKGELVFKEQPFFIFPAEWYDKTEVEFSELMQAHVFPNMTDLELSEFLTLADAFPDDQVKPFLNRLVYSNVFDLNDQIGMFLKISRINHSCRPSILYSFLDGLMHLYASRDIEANEELHLSYVDTLLPKAERQEHLLKDYGFVCDCEICSANLTEEEQKMHDENRVKINQIYNFNGSDNRPEENILHLEHLLDLAKKEGVSDDDLALTGHIYYELLESLMRIPEFFNKYDYNVSEISRVVQQSLTPVYGSEFVDSLFRERLSSLSNL